MHLKSTYSTTTILGVGLMVFLLGGDMEHLICSGVLLPNLHWSESTVTIQLIYPDPL